MQDGSVLSRYLLKVLHIKPASRLHLRYPCHP